VAQRHYDANLKERMVFLSSSCIMHQDQIGLEKYLSDSSEKNRPKRKEEWF
jgi:hypothetical protein